MQVDVQSYNGYYFKSSHYKVIFCILVYFWLDTYDFL